MSYPQYRSLYDSIYSIKSLFLFLFKDVFDNSINIIIWLKWKQKKNLEIWIVSKSFRTKCFTIANRFRRKCDRRMVKRVHIFLRNFISALNRCIHSNLSSVPNRRIRIVANLNAQIYKIMKMRMRFLNGREIEIFHFSYLQFIVKNDK